MSASGAASAVSPVVRVGGGRDDCGPDVHPFADAAEEVRAWLVSARGGAPFLSGSDGRRLADWLEGGVAVRDLLRAIDETAVHRRAKRLHGPFSLKSIEPVLKRMSRPTAREQPTDALNPSSLRTTSRKPQRAPAGADPSRNEVDILWPDSTALEAELVARIAAQAGDIPDALFLQLSGHIRQFFIDAWASLAEHHPALLAEALAELGDVAALVDETTRAALCQEYAREHLRSRYPLLRSGGILG